MATIYTTASKKLTATQRQKLCLAEGVKSVDELLCRLAEKRNITGKSSNEKYEPTDLVMFFCWVKKLQRVYKCGVRTALKKFRELNIHVSQSDIEALKQDDENKARYEKTEQRSSVTDLIRGARTRKSLRDSYEKIVSTNYAQHGSKKRISLETLRKLYKTALNQIAEREIQKVKAEGESALKKYKCPWCKEPECPNRSEHERFYVASLMLPYTKEPLLRCEDTGKLLPPYKQPGIIKLLADVPITPEGEADYRSYFSSPGFAKVVREAVNNTPVYIVT